MAAREAHSSRPTGHVWISGFGMQPPSFGGVGLDRIDVVLTVHGLDNFAVEYPRTFEAIVDGVLLRVLPFSRVIASKRATNRFKDQASLPILEATLVARNERPEE